MADFHRILGVSRDAGPEEIKRAYCRLARRHHPDVAGGGSGTRFRQIRAAYDALRARSRGPEASSSAGLEVEPDVWLADEVAIDFPAVGAIFDRIRESFLRSDDRSSPLSADIELTPGEAREGVTVPLAVPLRVACALCHGRGELWLDLCHGCGGSGESFLSHTVRLVVPAGTAHGARVRLCLAPTYAPSTVVDVRITVR